MIHGIYVRTKPKNKWQLFSISVSQEVATKDIEAAEEKYKLEGYDNVEIAVKVFNSGFHIPEFLSDLKKDQILFN